MNVLIILVCKLLNIYTDFSLYCVWIWVVLMWGGSLPICLLKLFWRSKLEKIPNISLNVNKYNTVYNLPCLSLGIPISHQHLLYNLQELEDSSCLLDYSIQDGATLKLVLSVRGGPISTRRLSASDDCGWKELRDFVQKHRYFSLIYKNSILSPFVYYLY